ncbi:putative cysteine ligase BshC [Alicyclobacillus hesperidum subsp. aegles]|uniref:bacillithiol biosynthesis cysteine-adding enzyme BshC n=1 Tax=Alicyclobacillus hesperidum TaxID=89784 RepID=UPI000719241C|nr:bacillithiol biosynthesis cysteine-adding enzyme BshC [Alicyclobacillus hesperidum]KRW92430.1 hypothetical protein SD51_02650 [Alicyclobacillus tengchongensis]GLG01125.1 putative cysteine ligase BshC [Alicyclobacillus hesperidum subsp. aegles]
MKCTIHQAPTGNRLTDAYLFDFASVAHLYDGQNPTLESTYITRADKVVDWFDQAHRQQLVDALTVYSLQIGASAVQREAIAKLLDPRSVAVVTGQQAGLFTGPLYSISKALSAIGVAAEMERILSRPVVPVFWIASEDHDFGEVDHAYVIDRDDVVTRIRLQHHFDPHQMVYHTPLAEGQVVSAIHEVDQLLPEAEYKTQLLHSLASAWQEGDSLAVWYARLLAQLLRNHPIVFLDPCLPALRRLAWPAFAHALQHVEDVQANLEQAYGEVVAGGFVPEVVRDPLHSTVFRVVSGRRYVLERADGGLRTRGHGEEKNISDWLAVGEQEPTAFSANVLLRPVVQDYLLPTLAYVGGPSEIAYHALARAVFHAHERSLPPLIMRQRMRIAVPSVWRAMTRWQIEFAQVREPADLVYTYALGDLANDIEACTEQEVAAIGQRLLDISTKYRELGPQVDMLVQRHMKREAELWAQLRRKLLHLAERRRGDDVRQLRRIERWFWTDGHEQERRLSPLNLWSELGCDWFGSLPVWGSVGQPGAVLEIVVD